MPNKLPLALGIFGGSIVLSIVLLSVAVGMGVAGIAGSNLCLLCTFPILLLINVGAALFTYDTAAKLSNGQYKPLIFKK